MVLAKKTGKIPIEVEIAAGTVGMRLADIADFRVGSEFVTIINLQGQKYTFELTELNPPAPPAVPAASKPRRKRASKTQKELKGVL